MKKILLFSISFLFLNSCDRNENYDNLPTHRQLNDIQIDALVRQGLMADCGLNRSKTCGWAGGTMHDCTGGTCGVGLITEGNSQKLCISCKVGNNPTEYHDCKSIIILTPDDPSTQNIDETIYGIL